MILTSDRSGEFQYTIIGKDGSIGLRLKTKTASVRDLDRGRLLPMFFLGVFRLLVKLLGCLLRCLDDTFCVLIVRSFRRLVNVWPEFCSDQRYRLTAIYKAVKRQGCLSGIWRCHDETSPIPGQRHASLHLCGNPDFSVSYA